ncbi:DUF6136 family protein [Idiomarina sp. PL1-037]|uniref:DUF6136 family protein n=1 Tax=Idiomarina sp. PL1-037 TaxID=3095365 RepID=UPI002ACBDD2C|nr:DUF6136 family protein [Idiomarina sp. PL1-037]WQC52467.1 DUF6136 family protein [Idiomarina sp. PL1-037]
MSYWLFRIRIYHESLKQWLDSLRQISMGLVALFPLALPALIMLPLLSIGIMASPETSASVYLNTLWGYLLLLYSWMSFQRDGICATHYQLYINSLPTKPLVKSFSNLGLILYGANFFILGPLILLLIVLFQQSGRLLSGDDQLWYELIPLTGVVVIAAYYGFFAVNNRLPWFSLLLFPFLAFALPWELTKPEWLILWSAAILVERFIPSFSITLGKWPKGLFRQLLQADIASPNGEKLRLVTLLLLIAITRLSVSQIAPETQPYLLNLVSFVSALLLASSLFGTQALRKHYHLYLGCLPESQSVQLGKSMIYAFIKALAGVLLILLAGIFTEQQWALWLLFYVSTALGILLRPQWFLLFPCMAALLSFLAVSAL